MSRRPSRDDLDRFHDYNIYLPTRTIYMGSEFYDPNDGESGTDGAMAARAIKNLHMLDNLADAPITIVMNNLGGDEYACFAIIDAIKQCRSHITVVAMGHAMSAGSLILQAADKRVMGPLAVQMIHYGSWSCSDHSKTFQRWAKEGRRIDDWMENYYLERIREKHPKFPSSRIKAMLNYDTFLTAQESVDIGLCDEVLGADDGE